MPLFSRIRKTVSSVKPKSLSSSAKGTNSASDHHYLRSTKSSTEKSLKPNNSIRSTHSISNSRNGRTSSSSKVLEIDYAPRDGPLLRRSSTFTLEDEEIENTIPEQRYRSSNGCGDDVSINDEYRHRNADSNSYGRSRGKLVFIAVSIHELHYIHTRRACLLADACSASLYV